MNKLLMALIGAGWAGLAAATPVTVALPQPTFAAVRSDYGDRPFYGSFADPMQLMPCYVDEYEASPWQGPLCTDPPRLIWPFTNFYATVGAEQAHWTLNVNNEPAFTTGPCNTGLPNRSMPINAGPAYLYHTPRVARLYLAMTETSNCGRVAYVSLNNFTAGTLRGQYGDDLRVSFQLTANGSGRPDHLQYLHFFVRLVTAEGIPKFAWLYLLAPPDWGSDQELVWRWPIRHSGQAPGAFIRFLGVAAYNALSGDTLPVATLGTTQRYAISLDRLIRTAFPADAHAGTRIEGIEFSVEQEFRWSLPGPHGLMFTTMEIADLVVTRTQP